MLSDFQRLSLLINLFDAGQQLLGNAIVAEGMADEVKRAAYLAKIAEEKSKFLVIRDQVLIITGPL